MSIERKNSFGPLSSNPPHEATAVAEEGSEEEDVPPVPPIPSPLVNQVALPVAPTLAPLSISIQENAEASYSSYTHTPHTPHAQRPMSSRKRNLISRGGDSILSSTLGEDAHNMDLQTLLSGIDGRAGESRLGNVTRPPY